MPKADALPRSAERTTIVKDVVPAPPLPANAELFPDAGGPPAAAQTEEGFDAFLFLRTLKPEDWAHYMIYLYWTPAGQRRLGPNIDVITEPITLEWVKKKFGGSSGGRFVLWVNRVTEPTWRRTTEFEIEGERIYEGKPTNATPPPATAETSQLLTVLNRLLDRLERQQDPSAKESLEMATSAYKTSLQTIASAPPATPKSEEGLLITLLTVLEKLGVIGNKTNSTMQTLKELKELGIIGAGQSTSDPLKMVETVGKMVTAVKELTPEGSEGGDWKSQAVRIAADLVPRIPAITADLARAAEWNARAHHQPAAAPIVPAPPGPEAAANPNPDQASPAAEPPPAAPPAFDMESFLWERVAYMIETGADGDQIAQYLHFSTAQPSGEEGKIESIISHFLPFTPGGLVLLLDSKPRIQEALKGKNKEELAAHFLYYCKTGELFEEEEGDDFPDQEPPKEPRPV